jgi:hypothetical protein
MFYLNKKFCIDKYYYIIDKRKEYVDIQENELDYFHHKMLIKCQTVKPINKPVFETINNYDDYRR